MWSMGIVMIEKEAHLRLGRLIDQAINQSNKSTREVANLLGIHQETVRRWRKGEKIPSRVGLEALANLLELDKDQALRLHAQARAESGAAGYESNAVLPPLRVAEELEKMRDRLSALEELFRNHIDNH